MSKKISGKENLGDPSVLNEVTTTRQGTKAGLDVSVLGGGQSINPLAKFVEATYSVGDTVVTYNYYESSAKVTLYNTITVTYSVAQDTSFTSAEWS